MPGGEGKKEEGGRAWEAKGRREDGMDIDIVAERKKAGRRKKLFTYLLPSMGCPCPFARTPET